MIWTGPGGRCLVVVTPTLAKFMQTLPDVRFDGDEVRKEVHHRNSLRQASNFSQLNMSKGRPCQVRVFQ